MSNRDKLAKLMRDIFLLRPEEFTFELKLESIETWDSLGVVSLAVGVNEVFGYHMTPEEATSIKGVPDIIALLRTKGILFDD